MNKPVCLVDLDDTLFQTQRKMTASTDHAPFRSAVLDRHGQPQSYMNHEQALLMDWLLTHAQVIPVTARSTEQMDRVQLAFTSWQITTHGTVIRQPDGSLCAPWQQYILSALAPYAHLLAHLQQRVTAYCDAQGWDIWAKMHSTYEQVPAYLVIKHRDGAQWEQLYRMADTLEQHFDLQGFNVYRNGNNITWLPETVGKASAVAYLLAHLRKTQGVFPTLGLGDSLSDHPFLQQCSWFGMPKNSQLAQHLNATLPQHNTDGACS